MARFIDNSGVSINKMIYQRINMYSTEIIKDSKKLKIILN